MKNILYIIISLFLSVHLLYAQNDVNLNNSFHTHLAYYSSTKIAEANNLVYTVTNGSLLSFNKTDNSVLLYSRQTGLSDNAITNIAYNSNTNTLLIIYNNGNIDLLSENGSVYNISHFMNNTSFIMKVVINIDIYGDIAYLSMQFGVIALDMNKKEIRDTYRINSKSVYSVSLLNNELYATTVEGIYKAATNSNLVDIANCKPYNPSLPKSTDVIIKTVVFNNQLCYLIQKKGIYYQDNNGTIKTILTNNSLVNLKVENNKLISHTNTNAYIFSSFTSVDNVNFGTINDISSLKDQNTFWAATGTTIMKGAKKNSGGSYDLILSELSTDSPKANIYHQMNMDGNKLLIAGGGYEHDRFWKQGIFSIYDYTNENKKWFNFDQSKLKYGPDNKYNSPQDIIAFKPSPIDPSIYYIASYGEGLFEIKDNEFTKSYSVHNSPLETVSKNTESNSYYNYIRISDIAFDKDNNLWMTNVEVNSPIKVLKPDGTWLKFNFSAYLTAPQIMDKILITSQNHKWLNFPFEDNKGNKPGIFIFKDNDLSEDGSQAIYLSSLINRDGEDIGASAYRCMAEDKKGNIWVGTNKGPIYTPIPTYALEDPSRFYFNQIIRQNEGGNYIFLNNEQINAIAVDGGNRKWLGTESSGVFLVNEDGSETIYNFTTNNSPLLSNRIVSLEINKNTGEVFIGTSNGLISFMGEGSEGKEDYSEVYAYPNPVRPEYEDKVTITGLMTDSNVKITDINGNLIYQAKSIGGQLVWNCRNHKGSRVATGIYLVIAASQDSAESVATKIMVIK